MRVSEQHGVNSRFSGPFFKHAKSAFDPVGISVHQQKLLSFILQEQLSRRSRADIAISGYMDNRYIQRMCKDLGIFTAIAEMNQGIECSGHVAGQQGQGDIPVAIRHNKDTHGFTVADSEF
jgi:hypothetical protein